MWYARIFAELTDDGQAVRWRVAQGRVEVGTPMSKTYLSDGEEVTIWWKGSLPSPKVLAAAHRKIAAHVEHFRQFGSW